MKAVYKTAYPYLADAMNLPLENLEDAVLFYEQSWGSKWYHSKMRLVGPPLSVEMAFK